MMVGESLAKVVEAIDNDPKYQRLFYRFHCDQVGYLDFAGSACWRPWHIGQVLHWHPFKVALQNTKRAGLHIVSSWRGPDEEMRYGSNVSIEEANVFVMAPGQVTGGVITLEQACQNPFELHLLTSMLRYRFKVDFGATAKLINVLDNVPDIEDVRDGQMVEIEAV
jgi:hypothetical protein